MSIFQEFGIVWSDNTGLILVGFDARKISEKPDFSFEFDSLYCEPTLCHKVVNGHDKELTKEEIEEVWKFLEIESKKPKLVNCVNKDGKYFEGIPEKEAFRIVKSTPPKEGIWRLDMTISPDEYWYQPVCVDKKGFVLIDEDESKVAEFLPNNVTIPPSNENEVWKWNKSKKQWQDSRTKAEKVEFYQEAQLMNAKYTYLNLFETVTVEFGTNNYSFGIDDLTKNNLKDFIDSNKKTIDWYPKGALEPVTITKNFAVELYNKIIDTRDEIINDYFENKKAIQQLNDVDKLVEYQVHFREFIKV